MQSAAIGESTVAPIGRVIHRTCTTAKDRETAKGRGI